MSDRPIEAERAAYNAQRRHAETVELGPEEVVMVAIAAERLTFDVFLAGELGSDSGQSFELLNGVIVPISEPNAKHEDVVAGLCRFLIDHCQAMGLPYIPRQGKQVRLRLEPGGAESSRKADVVLFDRDEWERMRRLSISAAAYVAPPLAIEVVSINWRDDYRLKLNEYESLGILEYWIVDYGGMGGVQYIGSPKRPTVTVNRLVEGEYLAERFVGTEPIVSPTFPALMLTMDQIVAMTAV
jgi:Uma2 family endonuclease